ncbi:MAG: sigma-70 family RNA polymerase sigma factor [Planctomycetia bacterium]|nr:sigma-70 family RNA polymerase sigma factor [Planctomycetia bacterium]
MDSTSPAPDRRDRLAPRALLLSIETRRSLLPPPSRADDPRWEAAWTHLATTYAPAMRRYVARLLRGLVGEDRADDEAEDVVQAYLAAAVEHGWLSRDVARQRSFRSWLKMQLFRFTCDWVDHRRAQKRNAPGWADPEVLQGLRARVLDPAEADLDRALVETAVEAALRRLAERSEDQAEVIRSLLRGGGTPEPDLGARLEREGNTLAALVRRARTSFATLLAETLRETVRDEEAFADLLADLEPHLP